MILRKMASLPRLVFVDVMIFAGVLFLVCIVYSTIMSPSALGWLLFGLDGAQHFFGWHYFRHAQNQIPLGAISDFGTDLHNSIIFTDSIPLFCFLLKPLFSFSTQPVQIQGIVVITVYIFNFISFYILAIRLGLRSPVTAIASALISTIPTVLMRGPGGHGHESLMFIGVYGLGFSIFLDKFSKRNLVYWMSLLIFTLSIHFYFFAAIFAMLLFWLLNEWCERKFSRKFLIFSVNLTLFYSCICIAFMYVMGYFPITGIDQGARPEEYTSELLTFFNPYSSAWFHSDGLDSQSLFFSGWKSPIDGQYEGQTYVGAGIVSLWLVALLLFLASRNKKNDSLSKSDSVGCNLDPRIKILGILCICFFITSIGPKLVILENIIIELPWAKFIQPITTITRSVGRFSLILAIYLFFVSIVFISRKVSAVNFLRILVIATVIQAADITPNVIFLSGKLREWSVGNLATFYPFTQNNELQDIMERAELVAIIPTNPEAPRWEEFRPFFWMAANYNKPVSLAHVARNPTDKIRRSIEQRSNDFYVASSKNTLFVFQSDSHLTDICKKKELTCTKFNDVVVSFIH